MEHYYHYGEVVTPTKETIKIKSNIKWYIRLYYLITNPITYLIKGIVRY